MSVSPGPHVPVLLRQVIEQLEPTRGERFIDCTFGAGGYSRAILDAGATYLMAFDRDEAAIDAGNALMAGEPGRFAFFSAPFGHMDEFVRTECSPRGMPPVAGPLVDGIVLDLGVSSMQLDRPERGFSFQADGPLDMRMSQTGDHAGRSAADLVNALDQETLADILYTYGEEKKSRWIAHAIVKRRAERPFERTLDLASVIARVLGPRKADGRHQATRSFQALRIAVNDELGELVRALIAAEKLLRQGGRLVVVTFHSLEDRIVKRFLQARAGKQAGTSRHLPEVQLIASPSFEIVNHRPLTPDDGECDRNPRSRSAKLRAARRTDAAPWPADGAIDLPLVII